MKNVENQKSENLKRVDSLITKTRGKFLEDGIVELWTGLFLLVAALLGFVEQNYVAYYPHYMVFYVSFAIILAAFGSFYFWRKAKIMGASAPPTWIMIGFLYFPLLMLPRRTEFFMYGPMMVHLGMSLAVFYFTRFKRCLFYAGWAIATYFISGLVHDYLLPFNNWHYQYQIAINSLALIAVGAVIFTDFHRKYMKGKLFVLSTLHESLVDTEFEDEEDVTEVRNRYMAEKKRKIGFNFNHGIPDLMISVLVSLIAWWQYSFTSSNLMLFGFILVITFILIGILGWVWGKVTSSYKASLGLWRGTSRLVILNLIFFVLGFLMYLTHAGTSTPLWSLVMFVLGFVLIAILTRIPRYWVYSTWTLIIWILTALTQSSASNALTGNPFFLFSLLVCIPILITGLYLLQNFFKNYPMGGTGNESLIDVETAKETIDPTYQEERSAGPDDFLKAQKLLKRTKGSFFEDGSFEIFIGFLLTATSIKQFIEIYNPADLGNYTVAMYAILIVSLVLLGIWGVLRNRICGVAVPGLWIFLAILFYPALIIGDQMNFYYTTPLLFLVFSLGAAFFSRINRYYTYAVLSIVSFIPASIVYQTYFSKNDLIIESHMIAFSIVLVIGGIITVIDYYRKNMAGQIFHNAASPENNHSEEAV